MNQNYHIPVLRDASVDALIADPKGVYVDVTFGGGGHSQAILSRLEDEGTLYGFDQDLDVLDHLPEDHRFTFVRSNFRYLSNFMLFHGEEQIDGLLADLGVSSHHFDQADRGFSFRFEESELDMRMNRAQTLSAKEVINDYDETALANLFYYYGELKQSRRLASLIVQARKQKKIQSAAEWVEVVRPALNRKNEKKELAQLFQAVRIEVNDELTVLKRLITQAASLIRPGGKLVFITYHSLEDRLVKNYLKAGNFEGTLVKDFYGNIESPFSMEKIVVPSDEEILNNPRSRSAKLRIGTKK